MNSSVLCARCRQEVPAASTFCPACGFDLHAASGRYATGFLPISQPLHGRYVIERRLAQGGQSALYIVRDMLDGGTQRALKEMSESNLGPNEREKAINDFIREAEMLRSLDHPALTKVYDRFVEGQKHFLVMEYIRGRNLEDELIATGQPLEWRRVVQWGIQLCDVLWYLHNQNPPIIYRDLKPANVMLTPEGRLKLVDFGIARWLYPARARDTSQLGTDGYAPLEQYTARSEPRSDIYALGASLYHLLTGRVPEGAPTRMAGQPLTPIRDVNPAVPEAVEHVVLKALALQARERFAHATQFSEALEWTLHPQSGPLHESGLPAGHPLSASTPSFGVPRHIATSGPAVSRRHTSQPIPPRLQVRPLRLDAGFLEMDELVALTVEIANSGGGEMSGHTETNHQCLRVEPRSITPETNVLRVALDTTGLRDGPYTCHVAVRTNGGDQIIPVRFIVRPPRGVGALDSY